MLQVPKFTQSQVTQQVYDLFIRGSLSEAKAVTYGELTSVTGLSREMLRSSIRTVRNRMRADHGVVFECDPNFGYRVVPNDGLAEVGLKAIERSRRQVRSGIKSMEVCEVDKLSVVQRGQYFVRKSLAEMIYKASHPVTRKNIEQMVHRSHNELTNDEQLAAIKEAWKSKK